MRGLLAVATGLMILAGCGSKDAHTVASKDALPHVARPATVSPAEWNSEPQEFPADFLHTPRRVLIHHSGVTWQAGTNPYTRMKNLQSWGQRERSWKDVPYHFIIAPNGQIFEGRAVKYRPDTNTDFDTSGFVNVEVAGSFGAQRVSEAQLRSAVKITAWLIAEHGLNVDEIGGHRDVASTACPGEDLYQYIHVGPFKDWVRAALRGEEPAIALMPPLPDGPTEMIPDTAAVWTGPGAP